MKIRSANPTDASQIALLNEVFVSVTSPMNAQRFLELFDLCSYCLVIDDGERLLGFVIAMRNAAPYDNGNYQWFETRVQNMVYVDRIVLAADARGHGLGHQLYDELSTMALADGCKVMTAEMDIEPPNTHSLHFHGKRGFVEHGQRLLDGGKRVSMQCRDL
ncbi:MAG: GNAT family N-acetyltransferase [Pseudomonadota bacterium]|nr:GNAT family N-acetyltransferase [Pseudomonadota bacterium]